MLIAVRKSVAEVASSRSLPTAKNVSGTPLRSAHSSARGMAFRNTNGLASSDGSPWMLRYSATSSRSIEIAASTRGASSAARHLGDFFSEVVFLLRQAVAALVAHEAHDVDLCAGCLAGGLAQL